MFTGWGGSTEKKGCDEAFLTRGSEDTGEQKGQRVGAKSVWGEEKNGKRIISLSGRKEGGAAMER